MAGFVEGVERGQVSLFPAQLDDYVADDNPVRAVDAFVEGLDLAKLGFTCTGPLATGRPGYRPGTMLKIYIYGYLNRIPSSRRLERECQRNIELIWLTGKLAPDQKAIADFRKDNGKAIREVCRAAARLYCCAGSSVMLPKPQTSGAKAEGRFGKQDFVYKPEEDAYRCPRRRDAAVSLHERPGW